MWYDLESAQLFATLLIAERLDVVSASGIFRFCVVVYKRYWLIVLCTYLCPGTDLLVHTLSVCCVGRRCRWI